METISDVIISFRQHITLCSKAMTDEYGFTGSIYAAYRDGVVPKTARFEREGRNFYFNFHGKGCHFTINDRVFVDFDFEYVDGDFRGLTFDDRKIQQFYNSAYARPGVAPIRAAYFLLRIRSLVRAGLLKRSLGNYPVYWVP